jgi:membrane-associated phospholipid phosphatase
MGHLWPYECLVVGYFAYLIATAAGVPRVPAARRGVVIALSSLVIAAVTTIATIDLAGIAVLRLWLPLLYLPLAYWLPGQLVTHENRTLEQLLLRGDRFCFGDSGLARFRESASPIIIGGLEVAYLACYPLVPMGFVTLIAAGYSGLEVNRFWIAVLGAALLSYGPLPWLPSRPPREIEFTDDRPSASIRDINRGVLTRVGVGWNTFPSGHAAASVATALAIGALLPWAGLIFGAIAAGICAGSVVGRYHYALDVVVGVAVAGATFALSRSF